MRCGKNVRLPRGRRDFVAFELADDLQRAVDAVQREPPARRAASDKGSARTAAVGTGSISRRSVPSVRRWMRASTRRLHHSSSRRRTESSAQDLTFGFEPQQRALDRSRRGSEASARVRPTVTGPLDSSQPRTISVERRPPAAREAACRRRPRISGSSAQFGVRQLRELEPFGAHPEARAAGVQRRRAPLLLQARRTMRSTPSTGGSDDERRQRVVQFVGVAHDRPRLLRRLPRSRRDRECRRRRRRRASPRRELHRARATLFERRVVEVRVRIRVEDLVTERRRLGRVDGDRAKLPSSMRCRMSSSPSRSIASCKQLSIVSRTSTWSGMRIGPVRFSGHAA